MYPIELIHGSLPVIGYEEAIEAIKNLSEKYTGYVLMHRSNAVSERKVFGFCDMSGMHINNMEISPIGLGAITGLIVVNQI